MAALDESRTAAGNGLAPAQRAPAPAHPLEPLSAAEIDAACGILRARRDLPGSTRFPLVLLEEPGKDEVARFAPGDPFERRALVVVLDKADGGVHEAVVSITYGRVDAWARLDPATDGQPMILLEEILGVDDIVKADPAWRAAVRRRGVTNLDLIQVEPFSAGNFELAEERGQRLVRAFAFARRSPRDNAYAHPIEGLVAYVELNERRVVKLVDVDRHVPVPLESANFGAWSDVPPRTDLRPLEIVQPEGPSFVVDGHEIRWARWRLRISTNAREGLVLHDVRFEDGGRDRSILFRASVSEMVVPYADPSPAWFWRSAFDVGEYGLGKLSDSLELGCDCLGEIRYFDLVMADDEGRPVTVPNAVCLHEEDAGVLWKHSDFRYGTHDVRRSRRLVISQFAQVGNYDYGFFWYLHLDGSVQFEVKLNGIVQTAGVHPDEAYEWGELVAPRLAATHHQHLFCVRLDVALDGPRNAVYEVEVEPCPQDDEHPYGTSWRTRSRLLRSELEAQRVADPLRGRVWKVVNHASRNRLGAPVGYKLIPQGTPTLLAQPGSSFDRRAGFAAKHLWVTRHDDRERFAAGDHPNQHPGGDGLPRYASADRALVDEDVVLWHSFGATHVSRPEDWPVMPCEYAGFWLKPSGFFDRNPALDVPPGAGGSCHHDRGANGGDHDAHHEHP